MERKIARPIDAVLSRLDGVRQTGPGQWMARSPTREERTASLSVRETEDGRLLLNDFGGSSAEEIVLSLGLTLSDLFPERLESPPRGAVGRVPLFDWRAFADHSRTASVAVGIALQDIADGRALSESDAAFLKASASRLLAVLDVAEV